MRSESEKKSIVKSIKLSPLQLQHIEEQADILPSLANWV